MYQLQKFISYCNTLNVNVNTASEELLKILEEKFNGLATATTVPVVAPATITSAAAQAVAESNDNDKSNTNVNLLKFEDGWYDIWSRVTIHTDTKKRPTYKGVIKGVDLKSVGREKFPWFETHDTTKEYDGIYQDLYRRTSKMWRSSKKDDLFESVSDSDKNARGTYDSKEPTARAFVKWNRDGSIKEVSRFRMKPDPIGITKRAKINVVTPGKTSNITDAPLSIPALMSPLQIVASSIILDKNDPILMNDTLLKFWKYDPNLDIKAMPQSQKILGRVGEIGFGEMNADWIWANGQTDVCDIFDYKHNQKPTTVDLKSISDASRNLAVEKNKVDLNRMADIFGLMLVLDLGSQLEIKSVGFITKDQVLEYIKVVPTCLVDNSFYKIEKWYLNIQIKIS